MAWVSGLGMMHLGKGSMALAVKCAIRDLREELINGRNAISYQSIQDDRLPLDQDAAQGFP